jgi:serine/threonine-protein kinase RsbT
VAAVTDIEIRALSVVTGYVGSIVARSIWQGALSATGIDSGSIEPERVPALVHAMESGVRAFVSDGEASSECITRLRETFGMTDGADGPALQPTSLVVDVLAEYDVVVARGQARDLCHELGFPSSEQIKVATVVSELARNIVQYVGRGRVELELLNGDPRGIEIRAIDNGSGIADLAGVLSGRYESDTGMGMGLRGAQRLMDEFTVDSTPDAGTRIVARRYTR